MKTILSILAGFLGVTTATYAADMPVKAPGAPAVYDWTGCYIGVEGGDSWGRSQQVASPNPLLGGPSAGLPITNAFDLNGGLAGGTVGCNLQYNSFVFSVEDDASWTNLRGSANEQPPFLTSSTSATRALWVNTVRPRIGYAIDRFMVYGTGGVALAGTEVQVSNPVFGTYVDHEHRAGWVVGAGAEWAAWTTPWMDVTLKVEYLHADFGTEQYFNPPVAAGGTTIVTRDTHLTTDTVHAGLNLKFNSSGSAAVTKQ